MYDNYTQECGNQNPHLGHYWNESDYETQHHCPGNKLDFIQELLILCSSELKHGAHVYRNEFEVWYRCPGRKNDLYQYGVQHDTGKVVLNDNEAQAKRNVEVCLEAGHVCKLVKRPTPDQFNSALLHLRRTESSRSRQRSSQQ